MEYERLKDRHKQPMGGWNYRDKDLQKLVVAGDFMGLVRMCIELRNRNGLPIPSEYEKVIEHSICRRLPDRFVKNRTQALDQQSLVLAEVQSRTQKLLTKWAREGRPLVGDDVAKERAEICQHCVDNVRMGCLSCKGLDAWVLQWIGTARRTGYEDVIHGCRRGGFLLFAGIHFPVELLGSADGSPGNCWRRKKEVSDGGHIDELKTEG